MLQNKRVKEGHPTPEAKRFKYVLELNLKEISELKYKIIELEKNETFLANENKELKKSIN